MKSISLIPAAIFSLLIVSLSFAQKDSFTDKAPTKISKSIIPEAAIGVPSNGIMDKDPNAKTTPIPSDDMFDLIFEYPCAIGGGEAGIETDGIFIYTTKWNGDQFYKYEIDGTFIDSLTIPGVSNIRDLAWDGTYFFGGAASPTVYELDLENATLISSFTAPTDVRAIAYNHDDNTFYANNWGSAITNFDLTGANLASWPCGPVGDSYYGFAYDNITGDTYLWGYAQAGATQNEIVQISLPDGYETGLTFDIGSIISIEEGIAGGLCIEHICYDIIIIGMSQNDFIWGLELYTASGFPDNDLVINAIIEPASGVGYTNNEPVTIRIENHGWNPQTDFIVSFTHNGSPLYYDTVFITINLGETYDFTFDTTINMSMGGTHIIEACTHLIGDECVFNDCKTKILEVSYGSLEGYVTNGLTGYPIEGATVECGYYITLTGPDGFYSISGILPGTYDIACVYSGFCSYDTTITFYANQIISLNIELYPAEFEVDPDTLYVTMEPNSQTAETITLNNPGECSVDWSALVEIYSKGFFDLLFEYPVAVGGGEAGIETDGLYLYTTKWNGDEFYKYSLDGTFVETFTINGVSSIRDLAWDGTYFYGSAASPTVFEMDFGNQTLISSFIAPTDVRAIAYNENEDVFYANNWGSDITKFNISGQNLGSFPVGPVGDSYYGFAYDNITGDTYLWGYAQVGATQNELVQMELPSGQETGIYFDVGSALSGTVTSIAGGLFLSTDMPSGLFVIGGLVQNEWLWGIGQASCPWLFIEPTSGTLAPGMTEDMTGHFESSGLLPGIHEADIIFTNDPDTNLHIVHVILTVQGLAPPINLSGYYDCTDIYLTWEMPPGANPLYFNIYRDGNLIGTFTTGLCCFYNVIPEVEYCYQVTAVYESGESIPTPEFCITVPTPGDLEPLDLEAIVHYPTDFDITLIWEEPVGCLATDSYNIYRNYEMIAEGITDLEYVDAALTTGFYEYYVTAVYYFGQISSDTIYALIYGIDELGVNQCNIFPNPSWGIIKIEAANKINSIQIFDNQGKIVITKALNQKKTQIDVSRFEQGIYFISLEIEEKTILRKIVVE
jgi:hypothetical protein